MTRARTHRRACTLLGIVGVAFGAAAAINCASSEDKSVSIINACDSKSLNGAADPSEATVKLYVDTGAELLSRAQALEGRLKDACNKINKASGEREGADLRGACNAVAGRMAAAQANAPVPDGGAAPIWVLVRFDDQLSGCKIDTQAEAACRGQCAAGGEGGTCDPLACQTAVTGSCPAECNGTCLAGGAAVACNGECRGVCSAPGGGVEAGVPACTGECLGTCAAATWTGRCTAGCTAGFVGVCLGECNGSCTGQAVGKQPFDAGGDSGEGGTPPPDGPGGDGNCKGICKGTCTAKASGSCTAPCKGDFAGGTCAGAGACTGDCLSNSAGCTTTCNGFCVSVAAGACQGDCHGTCSAGLNGPKCEGALTCEANSECARICRVRGALAAKCTGAPPPEVRIAGDYQLYDALRAHGQEFIQVAQELVLLRDASDGMAQRTLGNFRAVGVRGDNARKCVEAAGPVVAQARASLDLSFEATQVLKGKAF